MAVKVGMKNDFGDVKFVKVGWSWTCFFFGSFWGIPWFMRKLNILGVVGVIISAGHSATYTMFDGNGILYLIFFMAMIGFDVYGGIKANELTIRNYYENGYKFTNPESAEVALMNSKYHIFQ